MHLSPPVAWAAVRSKVVVLLLLTFCLLLLPLWESVIVLCFVVRYFMSILALQSIILMGKRELVALLNLSSWCLVMVERLFLAVPRGCQRFVMWYFLIIFTYNFCLKLTRVSYYVFKQNKFFFSVQICLYFASKCFYFH